MPSAHLTFKEGDVIKLALEFLSNRELSISQLSLERETGVINGTFSDDLLFLRQLILDGQWDDVLEFIQPLETIETFDSKQVRYVIVKHKYIELLCIRSEAGPLQNIEVAVEEVVQCLNELEQYCPSKEDYNNLCLLLTLPRLSDHLDYKNWNPSNARAKCFKAVLPLVERFLQADKKTTESQKTAKGDRLIQLIIKGILYESCVEYCQHRATASLTSSYEMNFAEVMDGTGFSDSDLSLLSWLQCIPPETFSYPFEQKTLTVDVEQLEKPSLEASWSEQILVTPIKPKIFPHSATPFNRMRAADLMSRSLTPGMDATHVGRNLMAFSMVDLSAMSRSFAGFHLTGKKAMVTSVDRLFEESDVFSTSVTDLRSAMDSVSTPSKSISSTDSKTSAIKPTSKVSLDNGVDNHNVETVNRNLNNNQSISSPQHVKSANHNSSKESTSDTCNISNTELWREFQRLKSQICSSEEDSFQKLEENDQSMRSNQIQSNTGRPLQSLQFSHSSNTSTPVLNRNGSFDGQRRTPAHANFSSPVPSGPQNVQQHSGPPSAGSTVYVHVGGASPAVNKSYGSAYSSYAPSVADSLAHTPSQQGGKAAGPESSTDGRKSKFVAVTRLEDPQAIRTAEFHPSGNLYAIGSNSKTLRICSYPKISDLREDHNTHQPTVLFKRLKHHKGSIYCLAWNATGDLLATGSNDKSIKLMRFNADTCNVDGGTGGEAELTMHDGTVRDMCFMEDLSNHSSLLISGGAGDCKIYVTDCETATPFQSLTGHSGHILSLYTWGGAMFVSGSQDRTIRFWDLRTRGCVNLVTAPPASGSGPGSPVAAVSVDPSGRLMVSGHDDSTCMLYDIRGNRSIQCFRPHSSDIRTIRFSPKAFYLLTGSYDHKVVLTDLQGDLTQPLPSVVVAEHADKVIQGRWHPRDFSFLTTSADRTATLWSLPPN